jgi:hypothetical protein
MTWVVKHKRSPGSLIAAEYECPVHGRFTRTVERDEHGNPPSDVECDERECDRYCDRCDVGGDCGTTCRRLAPHVISSCRVKVRTVTAARRGKDPDPPPGAMDWKALAYDECSPAEWEAKERKKDYEMTYDLFKKAL